MKTQKWIAFDEKQPKLGDRIEIQISDDKILDCGKVNSLRDGKGWILIDCENYTGLAAKWNYLWRKA